MGKNESGEPAKALILLVADVAELADALDSKSSIFTDVWVDVYKRQFNVFALGAELIDPDTKESLGREEVKVGTVKISQVNPKTSTADIIDDNGIDAGAVLRKAQ